MSNEASGTDAGTSAAAGAWAALQDGALLLERSGRLRMRFSGPKAAEALTGLVTSDVLALTPGHGQYSAALTPKGKVIADLRIFARRDHLLVDVNAAAAPGFAAMIRKYVNPRIAKYEDVSAETGDLGIFGAGAGAMVRTVLGEGKVPAELPVFGHVEVPFNGESVMVARVPDFGVDGLEVVGPLGVLDRLRADFVAAGAIRSDEVAIQVARIEAGRPEWGVDMDDSMLAQEADLDRLDAISFTKGCYTGQETVARVHYRGHVNRHLRGVRVREAVLLPAGTELSDSDGKVVGTVRSSGVSPRHGAIGLAMVRREIEPGTVLRANWSGRFVDAEVAALPFTD